MLVILTFFAAHWYLSLFFQTFFLHRYASHASFTMSPFTEKVFYVLTWIFQGS
ncbi:MAG: acyl-CoA desaturase, partial [Bacteroidota bacterium]